MARGTRPDGTVLLRNTREISYRLREITKYEKNHVVEGLVVSQAATPSNYVAISAGRAIVNNNWLDVSANSAAIASNVASNFRIDLFYLTPSAGFTLQQGVAGASPVAPGYTSAYGIILCKFRRNPTDNVINTAEIFNEARHTFMKILENTG